MGVVTMALGHSCHGARVGGEREDSKKKMVKEKTFLIDMLSWPT